MKIEMNKDIPNKKEYYDEYAYCSMYRKKIMQNPKQKIKSALTKCLILSLLFGGYCLYCFGFIINIFLSNDTIINFILNFVFYHLVFSFSLLFIMTYFRTKKDIKKLSNEKHNNKRVIIFENDKLTTSYDNVISLSYSFDIIKYIIINKYSIVFYPSDEEYLIISIPIQYRSEIEKAINKYKLQEKVIDNTNLYIQ